MSRKRRLRRVHTVGTPPVRPSLCVSRFPHSIAMYGTRDDVLSLGPYAHLHIAAVAPAAIRLVLVVQSKYRRTDATSPTSLTSPFNLVFLICWPKLSSKLSHDTEISHRSNSKTAYHIFKFGARTHTYFILQNKEPQKRFEK